MKDVIASPTSSLRWPATGVVWFLSRPGLWLRPLAAYLIATVLLLAAGGAAGWWCWPTYDPQHGWWYALRIGVALAAGFTVAGGLWLLVLPLLLALVFDSLVAAVLRSRGVTPATVPLHRTLLASGVVVAGTLLLRLRWLVVGIAAMFTGPLAPFIAAYAVSRVAVTDAWDCALAARGLTGGQRLARLDAQAGRLRTAALVAGGLQLLLALTGLGWLLWLPSLMCGAALATADEVMAGDAPKAAA